MQKETTCEADVQEMQDQLTDMPWPPENFTHGDMEPSPEAAALAAAFATDIDRMAPRVAKCIEPMFYKDH